MATVCQPLPGQRVPHYQVMTLLSLRGIQKFSQKNPQRTVSVSFHCPQVLSQLHDPSALLMPLGPNAKGRIGLLGGGGVGGLGG